MRGQKIIMAGDVPADERVFIAPGASDAMVVGPREAVIAAGPAGQQPTAVPVDDGADPETGERTLHRYGRVHVFGAPGSGAGPAAAVAKPVPGAANGSYGPVDGAVVATAGLAGLDRTETLGLEAFRLRASAAYRRAKQVRPRAGEPWDMDRPCTDVAPPHGASGQTRPPSGHAHPAAPPEAGAPAAAATLVATATSGDGGGAASDANSTAGPLSSYLEGAVAVGLILVEGPTADLQFTAAERTKVVAEAQNGLSWLATSNPAAGITFSYDIQIVRLTQPADASQSDLEAYWRDPTMAKLGYQANFDGVYDYANAIRSRLGTAWGYVAFVTKYPVQYFAYAAIGGPRIVLTYANDGWGPDNLDRVFAHESSHVFGAVDEYGSSGCDCGGSFGRFGAPNGNCDSCAANPVDCLMRGNTFAFCRFTPAHIGWGRGASGNPVLVQSKGLGHLGQFQLVVPSSFDGLTHRWENFDQPGYPWEDPFQTAQALGKIDAVTMIQSNLSNPGSLECVVRVGADLYHLWRDSTGAFVWSTPTKIATGAAGVPSFVQGGYGAHGNFEMLYPATGTGLMTMWRNNDAFLYPWSTPRQILPELGHIDAVSLIQGDRGTPPGALEAVVRSGTRLGHIWRDQTPAAAWHLTAWFGDGTAGNPVLIESSFPGARNFEVIVPSATSGLIHFYRNNQAFGTPWSGPRPFATNLGKVDAVAMMQSTFQGHLEVVCRIADRLYQLFRDASGTWFPANRIA
jgi:hypothetical protein